MTLKQSINQLINLLLCVVPKTAGHFCPMRLEHSTQSYTNPVYSVNVPT